MRIVLFYSEVESFNCFTDLLAGELHARCIIQYLEYLQNGCG